MRRSLLLPLLLASLLAGRAQAELAPPPLQAVPELDLARYAGTWHEIARLPMAQEKECVAAITVTYTPQDDGALTVRNQCVDADGALQVADGTARPSGDDPAKLEIRFAPNWLGWVPFVWADYWVIAIDDDYRWAIVGEPDRQRLRFLAREPVIDAQLLESLKGRARTHGYDLDELIVNPPPR
jgi:apolipoprotein D and lipocalin family protein